MWYVFLKFISIVVDFVKFSVPSKNLADLKGSQSFSTYQDVNHGSAVLDSYA